MRQHFNEKAAFELMVKIDKMYMNRKLQSDFSYVIIK